MQKLAQTLPGMKLLCMGYTHCFAPFFSSFSSSSLSRSLACSFACFLARALSLCARSRSFARALSRSVSFPVFYAHRIPNSLVTRIHPRARTHAHTCTQSRKDVVGRRLRSGIVRQRGIQSRALPQGSALYTIKRTRFER